ncbi:M16 family metallopeptidase [Naumannella halotolerans]|uniref:Putative Zn-dependent peptidase n=1 Tax=Naumannella halotolerans TaxID=993414 RepID=A0A4R7J873_9ACTN|nr:pitrilysin family protein [Naumannella halotolerans]TDT33682.1 putative Zn-dependent peptidase [Naumannella halotolerans]
MITQAPLVAAPQLPHFATPSSSQLDNGLKIIVLHLPGQHVVSVSAVVDAPLGEDDPEGVGSICARTLDEGTLLHPGGRFAEVLENSGAVFGAFQELHGIVAGIDVPSTRLPEALELFAEALTTPELSTADVERHVALRLAEIEQQAANPGFTAAKEFRRAVYSADSRVSRPLAGDADSVASISAGAVQGYHHSRYTPDATTIVIGGDFSGVDPVRLVEAALGHWEGRSHAPTQPLTAPGDREYRLISRTEAVQANLQLGGFGIDRTDPRWPALRVALYAMGGSFGSRLNLLLREDLGYTYGVRLSPSPLRSGGSFALTGSFRTEVTADAIDQALATMFDGRPITEQEVANAVNYYIGSAPLTWATAEALVDQTSRQVLNGQPEDYLATSLRALSEVTAAQASKAYAEIVTPDKLSLIVVGEPSLAESLPQPDSLPPLGTD